MDNQYNEDTDIEEDQLEVEDGSNQNVAQDEEGLEWGVKGLGEMGMQPHPITGVPVESVRVMWQDSVLPVDWVNCPNLEPTKWGFARDGRGEIKNANLGPTRVKRAKCREWPCPCCKYIFTTRDAMLNHLEHRCVGPRAPHHPVPCPGDCLPEGCPGRWSFEALKPKELPRGRPKGSRNKSGRRGPGSGDRGGDGGHGSDGGRGKSDGGRGKSTGRGRGRGRGRGG